MEFDYTKIVMTQGVASLQDKSEPNGDYLFVPCLIGACKRKFDKQPDVCTDGGNDKDFFSFIFRGIKMFAAKNEIGGLTIMLPNEY